MSDIKERLDTLFTEAIQHANGSADWYNRNKDQKKTFSKVFRLLSIILIGLGGVFPLISNTSDGGLKFLSNWGYVSIALAGTLIFIDRFFGFSSGWIRYIMTEMEIRKQVKEFEMRWRIENTKIEMDNNNLTNERVIEMMNTLKDFSMGIDDLVKQETNTWATEFLSNIAELQKMSNAKLETLQPGCIKVVAKNYNMYTNLKIKTDGVERKSLKGSEALVDNISPGSHEVSITGESIAEGKRIVETYVVTVEANKTATLEITLP